MEQKHYMDIARVKSGSDLFQSNIDGFHLGDHIVIQEKMDGANASLCYDSETGKLVAFSRKQELDSHNTLRGFYQFVQSLESKPYSKYPDYIFFGEWLVSHTIKYKQWAYSNFYFYDVYDKKNEKYLPQDEVKRIAKELHLTYVNTLYDGEFVSWEHCKSFAGMSQSAIDTGEGVVVKNQSNLNGCRSNEPFVLKIVVEQFSEIKKENRIRKINDPQRLAEQTAAQDIVDTIVTEARVRKQIHKMIDEGILPEKLSPEDMKIVSQNLPKRIYDDCVKEEPDLVESAGKWFGRQCSSKTMSLARGIILGG